MDIIRRIAGIILILAAAVLAVHFIAEPLYFDSSSTASGYNEEVWALIDYLSAAAVVLGVIFGYIRLRAVESGDGPVTKEFILANFLFYGVSFLGLLFFFSWFDLLSAKYSVAGPDTSALLWAIIDAGLPLVWIPMGINLLKSRG